VKYKHHVFKQTQNALELLETSERETDHLTHVSTIWILAATEGNNATNDAKSVLDDKMVLGSVRTNPDGVPSEWDLRMIASRVINRAHYSEATSVEAYDALLEATSVLPTVTHLRAQATQYNDGTVGKTFSYMTTLRGTWIRFFALAKVNLNSSHTSEVLQ
jgi:hypothetical protein